MPEQKTIREQVEELVKRRSESRFFVGNVDAVRLFFKNADLFAAAEETAAENERLRAIVEKLDTTWDGVRVTPDMTLFYIYELNGRSWVNPAQPETEAKYCYSSREVAEAALAAKSGGTK